MAVAGLQEEISRLRGGEEDGWSEQTIPTPGQFLKRLHELDAEQRVRKLEAVLAAATAAHFCTLNDHEGTIQELRQRVMGIWSVLVEISQLCSDPDRDGLLHVSEVVELLPEGLRGV